MAILDIHDTDNAAVKLQALYPNGQTVIYLKTDVVDRDNVFRSFREAHSRFGSIDVVVGNAGILNENRPELVIQINLVGTMKRIFVFRIFFSHFVYPIIIDGRNLFDPGSY